MFSADFIILQTSIVDIPKIFGFSFFATTVAQIRQQSASTTFFGVPITTVSVDTQRLENKKKTFPKFPQSHELLTDGIEIHQSEPLA